MALGWASGVVSCDEVMQIFEHASICGAHLDLSSEASDQVFCLLKNFQVVKFSVSFGYESCQMLYSECYLPFFDLPTHFINGVFLKLTLKFLE